jgi:cytosine/adenosine deaminase-related metal-dependent hydrolase
MPAPFLLRAPFVVLDPDAVVADGAVLMERARVAAAGPARRLARRFGVHARDMGDAVLVPGLVNAHTHLELSALRGRLKPTADFARWVRAQLAALTRWTPADFIRSYRLGVRLSLAAGTAAVGDIARRPAIAREAARSPLRTVHHVEAIEPDPRRAHEAAWRTSDTTFNAGLAALRSRRGASCTWGLSPHAPYTVSPLLYRRLFKHARAVGEPVQTHLAETPEELELLRSGTGPLRDLLLAAGHPLPFATPPGLSPVAYLDRLGVLRPPLVAVHGNALTAADIETLARRGVTVVFCPRSHRFFRRPPHPVRRLLRAGVPVALGTDSLASNRDLDVRAEMREAVERHGVAPREAWRMATVNGARALRLDREPAGMHIRRDGTFVCRTRRRPAGTLHPGAPADLTVLDRPRGSRTADLLERLLSPDVRPHGVWVGGAPATRLSEGYRT